MKRFVGMFKLLRIRHYVKNLLVFAPLFFSQKELTAEYVLNSSLGFIVFCLAASAIYIINDIRDVELDRQHPTKRNRPVASGEVSVGQAKALCAVLLCAAAVILFMLQSLPAFLYIIIYLILNIAYSAGLKNIPVVDIFILMSGYVLRMAVGATLTDVIISAWLYMTVISVAIFLGIGKRRNEYRMVRDEGETRRVLKSYSYEFLDKNFYVYMAVSLVFYTLWCIEKDSAALLWTVPIVIFILMRYSKDIEEDSDGDPVEVVFGDRVILACAAVYLAVLVLGLYPII